MNPGEQRLCDDHEISGLIASMARKIASVRREGVPLRLVGVRSRGVPLAHRLAQELSGCSGRMSTSGPSISRSIAMIWKTSPAGPCCAAPRSLLTSTEPMWCSWMTYCSRAGPSVPP